MRKKYFYIIILWVFVFMIYSLLLLLNNNTNVEITNNKKIEIINSEKEEKIISLNIPVLSNGNEKIPLIIDENVQQYGVYKKIINLLLKKKKNEYYKKLKLNATYCIEDTNGIIIDFNDKMISTFSGGTSAEFEFLNYISDNLFLINTLLNAEYEKFYEINWVMFLSAGSNYPTISGHIDIESPFYKKSNIIIPYVNVRKLTNYIDNKTVQRIFIDPGHGGENSGS